jgi:hypothetical protein
MRRRRRESKTVFNKLFFIAFCGSYAAKCPQLCPHSTLLREFHKSLQRLDRSNRSVAGARYFD